MVIGRLAFGIRNSSRNKFKFFYDPTAGYHKDIFVFFYWIGWHWYICLHKKPKAK